MGLKSSCAWKPWHCSNSTPARAAQKSPPCAFRCRPPKAAPPDVNAPEARRFRFRSAPDARPLQSVCLLPLHSGSRAARSERGAARLHAPDSYQEALASLPGKGRQDRNECRTRGSRRVLFSQRVAGLEHVRLTELAKPNLSNIRKHAAQPRCCGPPIYGKVLYSWACIVICILVLAILFPSSALQPV